LTMVPYHPNDIPTAYHDGPTALGVARTRYYGFLHADILAAVAADPATRFTLLLVRCGGGRFLAPAQDVPHFMAIIGHEESDYVRDVSLPAGG